MRIYEYPFTQLTHAFLEGRGVCRVARRDVGRMRHTLAPSALDVCTACEKWLRENRRPASPGDRGADR